MPRRTSNAQPWTIYAGLPEWASKIRTRAFAQWLVAQSATLLHTTNPYEVFRYRRADNTIVILHKKGSGALTWSVDSATDYRAFVAHLTKENGYERLD